MNEHWSFDDMSNALFSIRILDFNDDFNNIHAQEYNCHTMLL